MAIFTFEEALKRTGTKPSEVISLGVTNNNTETGDETKPFVERLKSRFTEASDTLADAITGEGEFTGQSGLTRTLGGSAAVLSAPLKMAYEALPENEVITARSGIKKAGEAFGKNIIAPVVNTISDSPALQKWLSEFEDKHPREFDVLMETLQATSYTGEIAGDVLAYGAATGAANKAVSSVKNATTKAGNVFGVGKSGAAKREIMSTVSDYNLDYQAGRVPGTRTFAPEKIYGDVKTGTLNPELGTRSIGDIATKLERNYPNTGLSQAFKSSVNNRMPLDEIVQTSFKLIDDYTAGSGLRGVTTRAVGATTELAKDTVGAVSRVPKRIGINLAERQTQAQAIKNLPTQSARDAVNMGVDIADVKTITSIPKNQIPAARQVVKAVQNYASGASKVRPEEFVGKPMVEALKRTEARANSVGAKLGAEANKLGNLSASELTKPVFEALKKTPGMSGLKLGKNGVLDFSDTVLGTDLTAAEQKAVQNMFDLAVKEGTGKSKHLLRQALWEDLGGKKSSLTNLTATEEKAYESIRRGLMDAISAKNPQYRVLNTEYAKIVKPLGDLRKMMKAGGFTDQDILELSAGLLARRLTSNAASNPQLRQILRNIDTIIRADGKATVSIEGLQDLYNVLDRYYDIAPETGLQGQVRAGIEGVGGGVVDRILGAVKSVSGETQAVRQKALEELLKEIMGG